MMRRITLIVPLAIFVTFVIVAILGLQRPGERPVTSAMIGETIPDFDLPGANAANPGLAASDLKQGTVTLVNLFGSWCIPCRIEAPELARLADAGITIHAIAVRDTPENVAAFLEEYGDPFARIGMDAGGRMSIELGATGVPETFLIDGDGVVRAQWIGQIRPDQVNEIRAAVAAAG
ncbi:MAG: DsbE family thiol:disulfide interchange protein [Pseudomonadota bacterium]